MGVWGSALKCMVASVALLQAETLLTTTGCTCCARRKAMSSRYNKIPAGHPMSKVLSCAASEQRGDCEGLCILSTGSSLAEHHTVSSVLI